jgi:tetratricopeptide (TPR) repeat protein
MLEEISMLESKKRWIVICLLASFAGSVMFTGGVVLERWRSEQIDFYNAGITAHQAGNTQQAVEMFDRSLQAYQRALQARWLERFIYPRPNTELAARASFHKGMALIRAQQAEPAVAALVLSLRLNPGTGRAYYADEAARLSELALIVKYNLELLFNQRPDLAQAQGAGRTPGDGSGEPQRVPGQNPGGMPGPGNRDDL